MGGYRVWGMRRDVAGARRTPAVIWVWKARLRAPGRQSAGRRRFSLALLIAGDRENPQARRDTISPADVGEEEEGCARHQRINHSLKKASNKNKFFFSHMCQPQPFARHRVRRTLCRVTAGTCGPT